MDHSQSSNNPHQIRSRVTVVCAECKRLKLKCDRHTPCSSCTKRGTVSRCVYSPAAAEKVDLHSLNNRLMQVEAMLAHVTAGNFQSSYPPAQPQNSTANGPNSNPASLVASAPIPSSSRNAHSRAIAVHIHDTTHAIALSLDELRSAWMDSDSSRSRPPLPRPIHIMKRDLPLLDESDSRTPTRPRSNPALYPHSRSSNAQLMLPPINVYFSSVTHPSFSPSPYDFSSPPSQSSTGPLVTPELLSILPSLTTCIRILSRAKLVLHQRPIPLFGGWRSFERKALRLLRQRSGLDYSSSGALDSRDPGFDSNDGWDDVADEKPSQITLPFFAIFCAVLAIGAAVSPPEVFEGENVNAGVLYALSQQALCIWEMNVPHSRRQEKEQISFLVACIAGLGYLLIITPDLSDVPEAQEVNREMQGGKPRSVFPLVGKLVNTAREMGLGKESAAWEEDEHSSSPKTSVKCRVWEDFKRLVWWDVMFYDLFTSDALGHPPLISPLSYSTTIPEVDSTLDQGNYRYILARCRLVRLAQNVKHRLAHPDCCCGYTFDQAVALDDEIRRWSRESLVPGEDEKLGEKQQHNWELVLVAQMLVLRIYFPFLGSSPSSAGSFKNLSEASRSSGGKPVSGEKYQAQGNAMAMATQSCLGAAQTILRLGSKLHHSLSKDRDLALTSGPALMDFYSLERLVLDAVVITQSSTAVSVVSEVEVKKGFDILLERESLLSNERRELWESIKRRIATTAPTSTTTTTSKPQQSLTSGGMPLNLKRKFEQSESADSSNLRTSTTPGANREDAPTPVKQMRTTGGHPIVSIRVRGDRMRFASEKGKQKPHGVTLNVPRGDTVDGYQDGSRVLQNMMQTNNNPDQRFSQMGPFIDSPLMYPSEQRQPLPSYDRVPMQAPLSHARGSFDAMQSSKTLQDSIGTMPNTPMVENYVNAGGPKQNDSSASSPYQQTFGSSQFQRPENSDGRAAFGVGDSRMYFDGPDMQQSTMPSSIQARQLPFENHRPSFGMENSQTQTQPPNFNRRSVDEGSPSSTLVGSSTSGNGQSRESPPFPTSHPDLSSNSASGPGYYSSMTPASNSYEPSTMQQLRMRIGENPPGTPMYEKQPPSAGVYDKSLPPPMLPSNHPMSLQSNSMLPSPFTDQASQGMTMAGAVDTSLSSQSSQQAWSSNQNPAGPANSSVMQNSQPFWSPDVEVKYFS